MVNKLKTDLKIAIKKPSTEKTFWEQLTRGRREVKNRETAPD